MNSADLARLRELAAAATPGPWLIDGLGVAQDLPPYDVVVGMETRGHAYLSYEALVLAKSDASFIAAASPDVVVALCDRLAAAEAAIARVRAECEKYDAEAMTLADRTNVATWQAVARRFRRALDLVAAVPDPAPGDDKP